MSRCYVALALVFAFVYGILTPTPVSARTTNAPTANAPSRSTPDGEAIYRGLFFGEGPVAALFPELASRIVVTPQMTAARNRLVARIAAHDPRFFGHFAKLVTSGNPLRVRQGLLAAQEETQAAMVAEFGTDVTSSSIATECIAIEFVVIGVFIAAVAVLVLLVNAAEYINIVLEGNVAYTVNVYITATPIGPAPSSATSLALDRWSTRIATVLGAS